jgi:hypothetical protein
LKREKEKEVKRVIKKVKVGKREKSSKGKRKRSREKKRERGRSSRIK